DIFALTPPEIKIKILDLLPSTHIGGDVKRAYTLPLAIYHWCLDVGMQQSALLRKAQFSHS
ncbi:hypothetical protein Q9L58_010311, partial [Maublancomyces gigas]